MMQSCALAVGRLPKANKSHILAVGRLPNPNKSHILDLGARFHDRSDGWLSGNMRWFHQSSWDHRVGTWGFNRWCSDCGSFVH